jgi:uncharacterized protein (TIGR02145 family)/uncharacterized repeat protein (TIGR02543 family)
MKKSVFAMGLTVTAIVSAMLISLCTFERNNPLDEDGTNYQPPKVTIESVDGSIMSGDTIHFDTGTVVVSGNRAESRFQAQIDAGEWSGWLVEGIFSFGPLAEGNHTVRIQTRYDGGDSIVEATVEFVVTTAGYKPAYGSVKDTTIATDTGKAVTIVATPAGKEPINYRWIKDTTVVDSSTDTLLIASMHSADSGSYRCIAVNRYGADTSGVFHIIIVHTPVQTYTITYDGNGNTAGSAPTDANTYEQGVSITVKGNTGVLERTGYTFVGWNTLAAKTGTSYAGGDPLTISAANVILFAKWTQNPTYKVTYDGNGSTAGSAPADENAYEQGASVTVTKNPGTLENPGYSFVCWTRAADGSGKTYFGSDTLMMGAANVILFAKWTQKPTSKVTYNGNGSTAGTAPTDAGTYEQGVIITVKGNTGALKRTGYTFVGWNTLAAGTGKTYFGSDTLMMGAANVILFAKWTQKPTSKVTYDGNGSTAGAAPTDAGDYEQGVIITVKGNTGALKRTGYTFVGWNTLAAGTGTSYAGGDPLTISAANVILFAKWTQKPTYKVTYDGNGSTAGSAPVDENAYEQGFSVTVTKNTGTLDNPGYTLVCWTRAADGSGKTYVGSDTLIMGAAAVTLYAKWTIISYKVSFTVNDGSTVADQSVPHNTTATVPAEPTKTGSKFVAWFTDPGLSNQFSFTTPITAPITLYAKWTIISYKVSFTVNDGSTVADQSVPYNTTATVPAEPTKTGSKFVAWFTDPGLSNQFSFTTPITAPITLYAKWTTISYTVSFSSNGGSPVGDQYIPYNSTATAPTKPNRTGYDFVGWFDKALAAQFNFSTPITGTIIVYAKWNINQYTVTYNNNGGGGAAPASITQNYQTTFLIANQAAMTKADYQFAGWNTRSDGAGTNYAAGSTFTFNDSNTILYAKWAALRDADNNLYTTVTIGTQTWMVENLRTTKFADGTPITLITANATWGSLLTPAYCWYQNDSSFINPHGALYNWFVVDPANPKKIAPPGWHVPTLDEWDVLVGYLGGTSVAGAKLKEVGTSHWTPPNLGADNTSGFTAIPGGIRDYQNGSFSAFNSNSYLWFSTPYETNPSTAYFTALYFDYTFINSHTVHGKANGMSIRLLRD